MFLNPLAKLALSALLLASPPRGVRAASEENELEGTSFAVEAKASVGFETNPFESSRAQEGDAFVESLLRVRLPLSASRAFAAMLNVTTRDYFRFTGIDEYGVRAGVIWQPVETEKSTVAFGVNLDFSRQRIYLEFQRRPDQARTGEGGGLEWRARTEVTDDLEAEWIGSVGYQVINAAQLNNLRATTRAEFIRSFSEDWKAKGGLDGNYEGYPHRPPDEQALPTNRGLQVLEGRGFIGLERKLARTWTVEAELNSGANLDLSNGYYTAAVVAGSAELRWEPARWKIKLSAEPELLLFSKRPANLRNARRQLRAGEYVFGASVERALSKHIALYLSEGLRLHRTNANEQRSDATLNSFLDDSVQAGLHISY
ncbi:MAG: hypothetical protein M3Z22_08745 [Verrucomicrobiota bacterium]|nr:hypothetical protein [Verrucomicrobiota bacterium]